MTAAICRQEAYYRTVETRVTAQRQTTDGVMAAFTETVFYPHDSSRHARRYCQLRAAEINIAAKAYIFFIIHPCAVPPAQHFSYRLPSVFY